MTKQKSRFKIKTQTQRDEQQPARRGNSGYVRIGAEYELTMTYEQYVLVGSTVRSYLAWLKDTGRVEGRIENNMLLWETVK